MVDVATLAELNPEQLRELAHQLITQIASKDTLIAQQTSELTWRQGKIDKLTQELSLYRRWKYGAKAERLSADQIKLFDETCAEDIGKRSAEPPC